MSEELVIPSPAGDGDNLEEIDGIGPGYAQALNRAGIFSFADLGSYRTAEELREVLREEAGIEVPLWKIEKNEWLEQARHRGAVHEDAREGEEPDERKVEITESAQPESEQPSWRQHAGFSIFFDYVADEKTWQTRIWQTRGYHDESGDEVQFPGVEPDRWVGWILEKADLPFDAEPNLEAGVEPEAGYTPQREGETKAQEKDEPKIEFLDVQVSEVKPSSHLPEKQLAATIRFRIVGPDVEEMAAQSLAYRLEVHAVDLESGESDLVASGRGRLRSQVSEYSSWQQFPFPEVGRYRLDTIALLLPPGDVAAYHHGPVIKIVP
jgi:hypothetical protein